MDPHYEARKVWAAINGPIPDGHDIHHKDKNPSNNSLINLQCLHESEHHKMHWAEREPIEKVCAQCFMIFLCKTLRNKDRFCSNSCKSAWRRASGIDNVDRVCQRCGEVFTVNKYEKTVACSKVCSQNLRRGRELTLAEQS